jgi:AcrR family transcriptional regulator
MALSRLHPPTAPDAAPGIDERRERQRADARRAILDATEALLIESGGFDFSIRSLGKRCGYSAPTVYHYFGDKDGLIVALLEERTARLADAIERIPVTADPLDDLRALLLAFISFRAENPTFARMMWTVSSKGHSHVVPAMERLRARVEPPLQALADAERFGGVVHETAGQIIWAVLLGLSSLSVIEPDHPWSPDLGERAIDTMLRGMVRPLDTEALR